MSIEIVVPDLGESITEATVAAWLKKPGDSVNADEPVVELETDKATVELVAPKAGVLAEILVPEGEDVEVGALLARLTDGGGGAAVDPAEPTSVASAPPEPVAPAAVTAHSSDTALEDLPPEISGAAAGESIGLEALQSSLGVSLDQQGPAVRSLLEEHGLDPAQIPSSGREGRLTKGDVIAFLERAPVKSAESVTETPISQPTSKPISTQTGKSVEVREERVKMTRMRRTIAARLKEAQETAAILTTFNEIDMSAVVALRKKHRESFETKHGVRLGFTSFFAKACVAALKAIPSANAEIDGNEIVYKHYYSLGMAVSSKNGLVVPVIHDCDTRSFAEIESELARLAGKARDGTLTNDEMIGGTFSITNGGVFGSMLSTPILNRPQSAILGLHKIEDRPIAENGEVVIRPMMYVALSYDHRLIDGREAVTFLVTVKECIEDPERLLLDL